MIYLPAIPSGKYRMTFFNGLLKMPMLCALCMVLLVGACSESSGAQSADEVIERSVNAIAADDYSSLLSLVTPEARYEFVNDMFQLAVGPRLMMARFNPSERGKRELRGFLKASKLPEDLLATADLQSLALPRDADIELALDKVVHLTQYELRSANGSETHIKMRETGLYYLVAASRIDIVDAGENHWEAIIFFVPPGEAQQRTITINIVSQNERYFLQPPFATWPWGRVEFDN